MRVRTAILSCALSAVGVATTRAELPPAGLSVPSELESADLSAANDPAADLRRSQLQAAQANAVTALRETVLSLELGRGMRVRDLVDRTNSADGLARALSAARPLGGPRWVDDQTCQVQVTVPGSAVADAVATITSRFPGFRPSVGTNVLNGWRRTAFAATGSSAAGGVALQQARPRQAGGRWAEVSDDDRRRAVAAAQADAVHQVSDDLRRVAEPLTFDGHATIADALQRPAVVTRVRAYLDAQPVTHIEFMDDLTVSLSMTVDGPGLRRTAQRAVTEDQPKLAAAAIWAQFRAAVAQAIPSTVTGIAAAPVVGPAVGAAVGAASAPAVVLPAQPPDWVGGTLSANGTAAAPADAAYGRLKVKGLADAAAVAELRSKLLALKVTPTSTLADAARADPQVAAAVSRVLLDARDSKVTFNADRTVAVTVDLNLRDAWDQLRSNP